MPQVVLSLYFSIFEKKVFIPDEMNSLNSFCVIVIVGSLLLLSFLLLVNPLKVNKKANTFFGIFVLIWATFWAEEVGDFIGYQVVGTDVRRIIHFIQFFVSIFFYFSVRYFTNPYLKLSTKELVHLIIPLLALMILIWQKLEGATTLSNNLLVVFLLVQSVSYAILTVILLNKHEKRMELFNADRTSVDINWIKKIIIGLLFITLYMTIYTVVVQQDSLSIFGNIMLLASVLFTAYHALQQKEIFILNEEEIKQVLEVEDVESIDNKIKLITDEALPEQMHKLEKIMVYEKPYLLNDLSLQKLAEIMDMTPHQLSYLLNVGFKENFFLFVNKYRVEEVKKKLRDPKYSYLSVIGIGFDSGFNSKTAFNTVFKKLTGNTPSQYQKMSSEL
jgi:AraC-like DNA-binding protein